MSDLNDADRGHLCQVTIECLHSTSGGLANMPGLIKKIIREQAWERRIGHGKLIELNSLAELIELKPIRGWGEKLERIRAVIKHDPEALAMFTKATLQDQGTRNDLVYNVHEVERPSGNSRARSLMQVESECDPETARAVFAGELSPHAALVKAGIREVRTVYFPRDPSQALAKMRKVLGDEYVDAMLASEAVHGS